MIRSRAALLGGFVALVSPVALATVVIDLSFEDMARRAPLIIRGTVTGEKVAWDEDHRVIDTYTTIRVSKALKGKPAGLVVVRQPGGIIGREAQKVAGAARFQEGEDVVLFLEPSSDKVAGHFVLGMAAGKVLIRHTPIGERAVRELEGLTFYPPEAPGQTNLTLRDREELGDAAAFLERIRLAVASSSGARRPQ